MSVSACSKSASSLVLLLFRSRPSAYFASSSGLLLADGHALFRFTNSRHACKFEMSARAFSEAHERSSAPCRARRQNPSRRGRPCRRARRSSCARKGASRRRLLGPASAKASVSRGATACAEGSTHGALGGGGAGSLLDALESGLLDVELKAFAEGIEAVRDTGKKKVHALEVGLLLLVEKLRVREVSVGLNKQSSEKKAYALELLLHERRMVLDEHLLALRD